MTSLLFQCMLIEQNREKNETEHFYSCNTQIESNDYKMIRIEAMKFNVFSDSNLSRTSTRIICSDIPKSKLIIFVFRFYCWTEDSMEWLTRSPGNAYVFCFFLIYKMNRCEESLASQGDHKGHRGSFVLLQQVWVVADRGWWQQTWTTTQNHPWPKIAFVFFMPINNSVARQGVNKTIRVCLGARPLDLNVKSSYS